MIPAANAPREFHCPRWPGCQCPDGTVALDCPGRTLPASSGDGGPARAPEQQASPAARAIDPDEAVNALKARGEAILAEMRSVLERSDDALWMIKRELGHRKDLIEGAFNAHIAMGHVQHDLRELVKDL